MNNREFKPAEQADIDRANAFLRSAKQQPERYFIDSLTVTGEIYMIPSGRRVEWHAFDVRCEETHEELPIPAWALPIEQLSHVEFERPVWVFK